MDEFDLRYSLGVPEEVSEPPAERLREVAAEPFALKGCVLTPDRKIEQGHVVVAGSQIVSVGDGAPDVANVIDTEGVILPGMIDLHGHAEFNVFAAWEPPELFENRYAWRRSEIYKLVVRRPWDALTKGEDGLIRDLTRYAEARALVGGVTAIQGASKIYPSPEEALVRNVDLAVLGRHKARSSIDPLREDEAKVRAWKEGIASGEIDALYIHLAEGVDEESRAEFGQLVAKGLLTKATVIIHGTALTPDLLDEVKAAGAKLVWSPQSNLRLYGQTTQAAEALEREILMGLGADWLPSGSQSLLAELKVARRVLIQQGAALSPQGLNKKLVRMVTDEAAAIAGLSDLLGTLAENRPADVVVIERHLDDPWANVVQADPSSVQLVMIGGDLAFGRPDWITKLAGPVELEQVIAWGRPMLIDTSYRANATGAPPPPPLSSVRAKLLERYPQTGPIFA